jgi:predicted nucleic acid-binding protein
MIFLDTNIILRAILNDHPSQSSKAQELIKAAVSKDNELFANDAVLTEVFWVLESGRIVPKLKREKIAQLMLSFVALTDLQFAGQDYFVEIMELYKQTKFDYVDLLLYVQARSEAAKVASFDRDFDKLDKTCRLVP